MSDNKLYSKEVADELKAEFFNHHEKYNGITVKDAFGIIDSYTEEEKELKWGVGKRLHWEGCGVGVHEDGEIVTISDTDVDTEDGEPYRIDCSNGSLFWVAESSLSEISVEELKPFEVGDFVCELSEDDNSVYELVFINRYNVTYIKTVLEGLSVDVHISNIRLATESDWEVEKDGVKWRARHFNGLVLVEFLHKPSDEWTILDTHCRVNVEDTNKIMRQLCETMQIPIKPDSSAKM